MSCNAKDQTCEEKRILECVVDDAPDPCRFNEEQQIKDKKKREMICPSMMTTCDYSWRFGPGTHPEVHIDCQCSPKPPPPPPVPRPYIFACAKPGSVDELEPEPKVSEDELCIPKRKK